jgi:hypothetical protein
MDRFRENPELFLTESDLKCRLFKELDSDSVFSREEATGDGEKRTNYVHSETSYFVLGKLNRKRVDLTVVKPSNYDFMDRAVARKGFYFEEPSIGIELKLNKNKSLYRMRAELIAVLDDLARLKRSRTESTFCVLVLDKKGVFSDEEISNLQREYREIRIFYATTGST